MLCCTYQLPTHAYEPRPHLFVDLYGIIWQAQNGDPIRAYRSSETPDKCRVFVLRGPYGVAIL